MTRSCGGCLSLLLAVIAVIMQFSTCSSSRMLKAQANNIRRYTLVLDFDVVSPFGKPRQVITVNGLWPSPTLTAYSGDRLIITVVNNMNQSTSIHWHGIIQRYSQDMDGVPYVTQKIITPNSTFVYNFTVDSPGSHWYHAHAMGQLMDGLRGPFVIYDSKNKPAPGTDHILALFDWYQDGIQYLLHKVFLVPQSEGREPIPDAGVMNGHGQMGCASRPGAGNGVTPLCNYTRLVAKPGGTCQDPVNRMRIISMAGFAAWNITVDGHEMQIVEVDSIRTQNYPVGHLRINNGQRYDVMLCRTDELPQGDGGYWIRAQMDQDVTYAPTAHPKTLGILQYTDDTSVYPTTVYSMKQYDIGSKWIETGRWLDPWGLSSVVSGGLYPVPEPTVNLTMTIIFGTDPDPVANVTLGTFDGVPWNYTPSATAETLLSRAMRNDTANWPQDVAPTTFFKVGDVVRIELNNTDGGEHPIHLHGQPYYVLAQGRADDGPWDPKTQPLNMENALLRDTATINANSYMVLLFKASIPGAWLFHCHIDWHMNAGLAHLFIVQP